MYKTAIMFHGKNTKMSRFTEDMVFNFRKQGEFRNSTEYPRKVIKRRTEIRNKSRDQKVNSKESVLDSRPNGESNLLLSNTGLGTRKKCFKLCFIVL